MNMKIQKEDELLRLATAAKHLGVHPVSLRRWADKGIIPVSWVLDERRFALKDLDALLQQQKAPKPRAVAGYARVSGSSGQETSLTAQIAEIKLAAGDALVKTYQDRASGLREKRLGLDKLLKDAQLGNFNVLMVTHSDRLARFGVTWLEEILHHYGIKIEILHENQQLTGREELLNDFMSLVNTFAGRLYGMRGKEAREKLLDSAKLAVDTKDGELDQQV